MIKKYWQLITIGVLIIITSFAMKSCASQDVKYIAAKISADQMAKNNRKLQILNDGYYKKLVVLKLEKAKVESENLVLSQSVDDFVIKSGKTRKEILGLKNYKDQAEALNLQLIAAHEFIFKLKVEYNKAITNLDLSWSAIHEADKKQINDLTALYGSLNAEYGKRVKELVKCRLSGKQRANIGLFAGYSIDGRLTAGFGITFDLIRIPVKIF